MAGERVDGGRAHPGGLVIDRRRSRPALVGAAILTALLAAGCGAPNRPAERAATPGPSSPAVGAAGRSPAAAARAPAATGLPGMPRVLDRRDVYAATRPGRLSPVARGFPSRVYVPNSESDTVDVIDPATYRVVAHFRVGGRPQHVVPSWDLRTLWVNNNDGNTLTPIDPATGRPGRPVAVADPYNLYFTPDGRFAVVMAERERRIDFRDPHTMALRHSLPVPCSGVNHADFTADGRSFVTSCEFSGQLLRVDTATQRLTAPPLRLPRAGSMPQDVKLAPDGSVFYVADMASNGLWQVDAASFRLVGFLPTGRGTHGLYASRDSRYLYASNRGEGTVSVVSFATRRVVRTWRIPGGGSPDMGGVSSDGKVLWLSGRYHGVVYAFDTATGRLRAKIPVGKGPHGLAVYPQPGRYSLGHTGVFR